MWSDFLTYSQSEFDTRFLTSLEAVSYTHLYYAMALDKMFFKSAGKVSPKQSTPKVALTMQLFWTVVLVFTGTFDMLTDMLIFVTWGFYALGAIGVFVLRKKMPTVERPYKTWGYPYVPIIFITFATLFLIFSVWSDIENYRTGVAPVINSLWGVLLLLAGVPFYFMFRTSNQQKQK